MTAIDTHPLSAARMVMALIATWLLTSAASSAPPELLPTAAILDAASLDPARDIPSGGWFVVRGKYLIEEAAQPASPRGVSVLIGGLAATIVRVRRSTCPGSAYDEILAIAPILPQGTTPIVVTTPRGATPPRSIRLVDFSPSLFGLEQGAGRYVEATASNGSESIGPLDLLGAQPLDRPIQPAVDG